LILISAHAEADIAEMVAASSAVGFLPKLVLSAEAIRELLGGGFGSSRSPVLPGWP
jgi:hypothetical protein